MDRNDKRNPDDIPNKNKPISLNKFTNDEKHTYIHSDILLSKYTPDWVLLEKNRHRTFTKE